MISDKMLKMIPCLIMAGMLLLVNASFAQPSYPKDYFRSPVDYRISLSGSYGEVRKNHFHSGLDIRTNGQVGKPVYAAADGYVCRINISPYGFGKTLYIQHANGYTTVYAHLNGFKGAIAEWTRNRQYKDESFALDVEVPKDALKVKKGDVIAYSGNSGASGGPHLHFEIRDGATQEPLDPQEFGIPVPDKTRPKIAWVRIIPWGPTGMVNFTTRPAMLPVAEVNGNLSLRSADTVNVSGNIIFGIEAWDMQDGSSVKTAIKSIALYVDGEKIFGQRIDRFPFSETRYVNSILDYPLYEAEKKRVMRSYIAVNDKLKIFDPDVVNRGIVNFSDRGTHEIKYRVSDVKGNETSLTFYVKSHPYANVAGRVNPATLAKGQYMVCTDANLYKADGISLAIPDNALYDDLDFIYSSAPPVKGSYSPVHHLQDPSVPLHTYCDLSIRADNLPKELQSKALIVKVQGAGKFVTAGGSYDNGFVKTRIREFGNYTVTVDTIKPVIRPVNIVPNKNISKQATILVKISDDLSGIKSYRGTLNGQWILMDYDAKRDMLTYRYDDRLRTGKNTFRLVVTDNAGNTSEYSAVLIR